MGKCIQLRVILVIQLPDVVIDWIVLGLWGMGCRGIEWWMARRLLSSSALPSRSYQVGCRDVNP